MIVVCVGIDHPDLTGNSDNWCVLLDQKTLAVSIVQMIYAMSLSLAALQDPSKEGSQLVDMRNHRFGVV